MKEIRTKLDVYIKYDEDEPEMIAKDGVYYKLSELLEKAGFEYQIYEQEIQ